MVRLDVRAGNNFRNSAGLILGVCIATPFALLCLGAAPTILDYMETNGIIAMCAIFAILLGLAIVFYIRNYKKAKDKIGESTSKVWRTTEGIFDINDPISVVETIVLYQDYTSQTIYKDLRKDDFCNVLLFNVFEKIGWAQYDGGNGDLYLSKGIDNKFYKKFCYEPVAKTLNAIHVGEELLAKEWCLSDFEKEDLNFMETLPSKSGMIGEVEVYHTKTIQDYGLKIKGAIRRGAYAMTDRSFSIKTGLGNPLFKKDKMEYAKSFENYARMMARHKLDEYEVLEICERDVKRKYFVGSGQKLSKWDGDDIPSSRFSFQMPTGSLNGEKKEIKWGGKVFWLMLVTVTITAIALIGAYNMVTGNVVFATLISSLVAGYFLSLVIGYSFLLLDEANEQLTPEGKEIVERIAGLKNFIKNYTQLKNPSTDNLYKIWDEFVLFANLFNLNSSLYEVAKSAGVNFKNQNVLDYFKNNNGAEVLIRTNHCVCQNIVYPNLDYRSGNGYSWYIKNTQ